MLSYCFNECVITHSGGDEVRNQTLAFRQFSILMQTYSLGLFSNGFGLGFDVNLVFPSIVQGLDVCVCVCVCMFVHVWGEKRKKTKVRVQ